MAETSSPAVVLLTLFGGIGGFLFGYDTGVISGALPYIRDELLSKEFANSKTQLNFIQELIVSAAIAGAGVGSALGGYLSDRLGRKSALWAGDVLFILGAAVMAAANNPSALIAGRVLVGLGIGIASVTAPVYIAECAPSSLRATLVTTNVLLITTGMFVSYLMDYLFTYVPGTWRWMLGVSAVPAALQALGLMALPESPKWLASKGRMVAAVEALAYLTPPAELDAAVALLHEAASPRAVERSDALDLHNGSSSTAFLHGGSAASAAAAGGAAAPKSPVWWRALQRPEVRAELHLGLGLQIMQQLAGINTIMYYLPAILELAGFRDKRTVLLVSLLPAGVNALGTIGGMLCIDRYGRRKLLLSSLGCVVVALTLVGAAFYTAEHTSPPVAPSLSFDNVAFNSTCYHDGMQRCNACLLQGCGFCSSAEDTAGAGVCMALADSEQCPDMPGTPHSVLWYITGCPSPWTPLVIVTLMLYLVAFAPGVGPVPWAVNAEIYPVEIRGLAGGAAATANWVTNALVSQTFLTLTEALAASGTFWLYAAFAALGCAWSYVFLPETSGHTLEEIQDLFCRRIKERKGLAGLCGGGGSVELTGSSSSGEYSRGGPGGGHADTEKLIGPHCVGSHVSSPLPQQEHWPPLPTSAMVAAAANGGSSSSSAGGAATEPSTGAPSRTNGSQV